MALKKCKECGKEVSTKAKACPNCGAKQTPPTGKGCLISLGVLLAFLFVGWFVSECSQSIQNREDATIRKEVQEQKQKAKADFEAAIDTHYKELVAFAEKQQFKKALLKINLFTSFERTDYRDVAQYNKTINTQVLIEKVKDLPASDTGGNLQLYKELLNLNPNEQLYKNKVVLYQEQLEKEQKAQRQKDYIASCQLEVLSTRWSTEYNYATYEGQVKNISNVPLKNVQAVVTWYDGNGNMITSGNAMIQYNPILPGQTSPFKVMETSNPAMKKAGVEFSHLMGGTIRSYSK